MPRGAQYDNGIPQSDNAIDPGQTAAHGTGHEEGDFTRAKNTAAFPDAGFNDTESSTAGSRGFPPSGSGKGGHDRSRTLGEHKGLGAHKADGPDPF